MHGAPAGVLMAPGTPQGLRRFALRMIRRHPWLVLRTNTFGNPADLFNTPPLAREFLFSAQTPDSIVRSCAARLVPESNRAARETVNRLPDAHLVTAPILVLGAKDDGSRIDGDASAVAGIYQADVEIFPDMGHVMMLEPGWQAVAERIDGWLAPRGYKSKIAETPRPPSNQPAGQDHSRPMTTPSTAVRTATTPHTPRTRPPDPGGTWPKRQLWICTLPQKFVPPVEGRWACFSDGCGGECLLRLILVDGGAEYVAYVGRR
jgi:Alpha/beta hydrolase family